LEWDTPEGSPAREERSEVFGSGLWAFQRHSITPTKTTLNPPSIVTDLRHSIRALRIESCWPWAFIILLIMQVTLSCNAAEAGSIDNPYIHHVGANGTLHLELVERTSHPHFWWPRTLLNYRILFDQLPAHLDHAHLFDAASGGAVPFQVSDLRSLESGAWSATLSFFSDLPTGALRAFDFRVASDVKTVPSPEKEIEIYEEADALILNTGAIKVRVPKSQDGRPNTIMPGPIESLADAKGWIGQSRIISPRREPQKITTEILDRGPLFGRVRITYTFRGGATYAVTIKAALGCDFVEVFEKIDGLTKDDGASFELTWTNLALTHRRGDEPIDRPKTLFFRGEDPAFVGPSHVENPAEEFYFRLAHTAAAILDGQHDTFLGGILGKITPNVTGYYSFSTNANPVIANNLPIWQVGKQHEFGFKGEFFDQRLSVTIDHFQITQTNVSIPNPEFQLNKTVPQNILYDLGSHGYELEIAGSLTKNISVVGSWTIMDVKDKFNRRPRQIANDLASLLVNYHFTDGFAKGLGLYIGGSYTGNAEGDAPPSATVLGVIAQPSFKVPSYTTYTAGASYVWNRYTFRLTGDNVFNQDYYYSSGARFALAEAPKVNVRFTASYKF